jgi:hypothetical protein
MRARVSRLAWLPPLCAFAVFVFEARRYSGKSLYFVDDPFISMRFAANLVRHGELSFNLGGKAVSPTRLAPSTAQRSSSSSRRSSKRCCSVSSLSEVAARAWRALRGTAPGS